MEHSVQDLYEMRVIVRGRVQGVGFRAATRFHAKNLGLKGTVKNLDDGTVEIYAQGSKRHLEELLKRIKEDVGASNIQDTIIDYFPVVNPHNDFRIIY